MAVRTQEDAEATLKQVILEGIIESASHLGIEAIRDLVLIAITSPDVAWALGMLAKRHVDPSQIHNVELEDGTEALLEIKLTPEGVIADIWDGDDDCVGTWGRTAQEMIELIEGA